MPLNLPFSAGRTDDPKLYEMLRAIGQGAVKSQDFASTYPVTLTRGTPGTPLTYGLSSPLLWPVHDFGGMFFDVKAYGARGDGLRDDTAAINKALAAAIKAGGGIVYFPPGTYLLKQVGSTVPILVTAGNIILMGAGRSATNLLFQPSSGGPVVQFNNSGGELNYCGIRDMSFESTDYVTQKTMVRVHDMNNCFVERISNTAGTLWWGSMTSVGVEFKGRQELRMRDCEISADLPVVINTDPNIASISFDHSSVESSDLVVSNYAGTGTFTNGATGVTSISPALPAVNALVGWTVNIGAFFGTVASNTTTTITLAGVWGGANGAQAFRAQPANYCVTIQDGVQLSASVFEKLALVCGIGGIKFITATSVTAHAGVQINNIRTEQSINTTGWCIDLESNQAIQNLSISNVYGDFNTNGIKLDNAKWPLLETISYAGTGVFLNLSAAVNGLTIMNSFRQTGSTITDASTFPSAIQLILGSNPPSTTFGTLVNSANGVTTLRSLALKSSGANLTLANGRNDNVVVGDTSFIHGIAGPTLAFQISGIVPTGANGQILTLVYNGGQVWTINNNDANSAAANRIFTPAGAAIAPSITGGSVTLIYDDGFPGWVLISRQ